VETVAKDQEGRSADRGRTTAATITNCIARQQIQFLFQRQVGGSHRPLLGRLGRYMFGLFGLFATLLDHGLFHVRRCAMIVATMLPRANYHVTN
jgi:hypothetical protein